MRHSPVLLERRSPVQLRGEPARVEKRGGWSVVREFHDEGTGPWLIDLSHCCRWDLQESPLDTFNALPESPWNIPDAPGGSLLEDGVLVNRMNATQASLWRVHGRDVDMPALEGLTDVTEATLLVALVGRGALRVAARLSNLDFSNPQATPPFLLQGPWSHVTCQIVVLGHDADTEDEGLLLSCPRGYARDMISAILSAGQPEKLRPAGEDAFLRWLRGSDCYS